jgi:hypothetical protein
MLVAAFLTRCGGATETLRRSLTLFGDERDRSAFRRQLTGGWRVTVFMWGRARFARRCGLMTIVTAALRLAVAIAAAAPAPAPAAPLAVFAAAAFVPAFRA